MKIKMKKVSLITILLFIALAGQLGAQDAVRAALERGIVYGLIGERYSAIDEFTEAIRLYPDFTDAYYYRSLVHWRNNDLEDAIADFTQVVRINPNHADAYTYRGYSYLFAYKDYKRAIADFEAALRIDPNHDYAEIGFYTARELLDE